MQISEHSEKKVRRFPALTVPHFRVYAATGLLSMAGDNVEHVIGYWVIWQMTHSPFWLGYAVVAHWLPFTLFSLYSGSLADRFDCRRLINFSQALYVFVSFAWGFLYLTDQLQIWHIALLLVVHGVAGLIFMPSSMLIIHEMVGEEKLVSAISFNASLRPLATTIGPVIGGLLMVTVGPGWGFIANILNYLPLAVAISYFPYQGAKGRKESGKGWTHILGGIQVVRQSSLIVALLVVVAASSFVLGNAFQVLMPAFAERLQVGTTGYSILLSASGLGAILGGFVIGWLGATKLRPVMVTGGVLAWSCFLVLFSLSNTYGVSLVLLCLVGIMQITFVSMAQSIIQAWAPPAVRGRVIGWRPLLRPAPVATEHGGHQWPNVHPRAKQANCC